MSTTSPHIYTGPIFDGDTHLYETPDAYSRYLPEQFKKDWGYQWKVGDDGEYALYVGHRKIEVSAGYFAEDGRVPPPGKLHEWLRAQKDGKENIDMRVPMTPDMVERDPRLAKMDEFGVDGCFLYCGNMVATISYLDEPKAAAAIMHAYNRWMLDDWGFSYKDRIYSAPLVSLADLDAACAEAEWAIRNGARLFLIAHQRVSIAQTQLRADEIRIDLQRRLIMLKRAVELPSHALEFSVRIMRIGLVGQ